MSLNNQLAAALANLSTPLTGPSAVRVAHGDDELSIDLAAIDSIACAFGRLVLQSKRIQGADAATLKKVSENLSNRVTYLLEPIGPIEMDSQGAVVQLRSIPPKKDDDGTVYYEMLVRGAGTIELRRWRQPPGGTSRAPLDAEVTREVMLRLVDDCVEASKSAVQTP